MRFKSIQNGFFITLLVLTTLAFVGLIRDFLLPVFWAAVLATLFLPLQRRWLTAIHGKPSVAALLTLLSIIVIVIVPLVAVGIAVARESVSLYERVASGEIDVQAPVRLAERALPVVTEFLQRFHVDVARIQQGLSNTAVAVSQFIASRALSFGQNALRFTAQLFLMLYILYFFIRDGASIIDDVVRALPLGDARERLLFGKFTEVSRATLKGTLVVGAAQGALGGVFFWLLGITAPVFWGVLMMVLSLLPAVGTALVWLPAAIILMLTGHVVKGIILIGAGVFVIGLIDNVLRPVLVGRDTRMPDYLILLSTLGGLTLFGLSGFVIGPIIASFFLAVWQMFADEFGADDDKTPASGKAKETKTVLDGVSADP
jgi:predicted PurR-regulated permease PerM